MPIYSNRDYIRIVRPLPNYIKRDNYSIPVIEPVNLDITGLNNGKWLINMKNANSNDKNAAKKIVHSFHYDNVLRHAYDNPIKYLHKVCKYYAVSSFDFTMDEKMDFMQILSATYDNRWSGAFMQASGLNVIPTVGWVNKNTYDICFSGLRDSGIFIISTLGVNNNLCHANFLDGYLELRNRFPLTKIICVGARINGMDDDVCYVKYQESFGNSDRYKKWWQPKLFNWDYSLAVGGDL